MRAQEFLSEATVRDQILSDFKKSGGNINDYYVRFTDQDKLGYSSKQSFGHSPDVDDPAYDLNYVGYGKGRPALWFYPLSYYLRNRDLYATKQPYAWLVRLKPNAWLQTVDSKTQQVEPAPKGKERVGIMKLSLVPSAVFFKPAFDVVGKYYDYAGQHKRHGEVKGRPAPTFMDRLRGVNEGIDFTNAVDSIEKLIKQNRIEFKTYEDLLKFVAGRKFLQAQRNDQRFINDVARSVLRRLHTVTEVIKMPPTKNSSQGMADWAYNDAKNKNARQISSLKDIPTEVYDMGDHLRVFVLDNQGPVLYLALDKFLDGFKSGAVAVDPRGRGKNLAVQVYQAVSNTYNRPIYSDTTQTDASRIGIWQKLIQVLPDRVVGYDQRTKEDLPLTHSDSGPVVRNNQPIYTQRKSKDQPKPVPGETRSRTRLLKLLPALSTVNEVRSDDDPETNYYDADDGFSELKVSERIQKYFYDRGYGYLGEGRDQMAFLTPRGTVLKILGIGEDEREDIVKTYVGFFLRNQRNPHYPRIYNAGDFAVDGETYFVYEMEYLNPVHGEERVLDYIEGLMRALPRGEQALNAFYKNNQRPPELSEQQVDGLVYATQDLEDAIGGQAPLDLSSIENLGRRKDGQIVIIDPFSL